MQYTRRVYQKVQFRAIKGAKKKNQNEDDDENIDFFVLECKQEGHEEHQYAGNQTNRESNNKDKNSNNDGSNAYNVNSNHKKWNIEH